MTEKNKKLFGIYVLGMAVLYLMGQLFCVDCTLQSRAIDTASYIFGAFVFGSVFFAHYPFVSYVSSDDKQIDQGMAIITGLFFLALSLGRMFF